MLWVSLLTHALNDIQSAHHLRGDVSDDTKSYDGVYSSNGAVTSTRRTGGLIPLATAPSPSVEHGPIQLNGRPLTNLSTIQLPRATQTT
ncbi:hypothetical protein EDB19DRAFT_1907741 [Suillus lakei]|nr:hypothetical protein EDB19DRAFT_1907741 [Suillus lakei]